MGCCNGRPSTTHCSHALRPQDSSLRFGWFFFVYGFQFLTSSFLAVGFPGTGGAGIWVAASAVKGNKVIGIMLFVSGWKWGEATDHV